MRDKTLAAFFFAGVIGFNVWMQNYGCAAFLFVLFLDTRLDNGE